MMVPSLCKRFSSDPPCGDRHELVQDHELQLEFESVAERLNRMADARLVEIHQDDGQDVEGDGDDVDIDQVDHDATLSDA